jgi:hypothetical protein
MSRVFIPQLPSRFDTALNAWIPTINIDPAKRFGELHVMLPPEASRLDVAAIVPMLKGMMQDYSAEDYVLAAGDPMVLSIVAVLATREAGVLRMLKWDRMQRMYQPVEVRL